MQLPELHPFAILQILGLLTLANGTPVIAKRILGTWLARPLDGGMVLSDGRALFGPSKTIRGILLSILACAVGAPLLGLDWTLGVVVAVTAMLGDLFSSFVKRRMNLASGNMALGLDQVPESLVPAIACAWFLPMTSLDIVLVTIVFFVGELALSRALFRLSIRDRPY